MYGLAGNLPAYSPASESAAFTNLHRLAVSIVQLKAQGNQYGVDQLLPYFREALDSYRLSSSTDPAMLSQWEQLYLSAGQGVADSVKAAGSVVSWSASNLLVPVAVAAGALWFLSRGK